MSTQGARGYPFLLLAGVLFIVLIIASNQRSRKSAGPTPTSDEIKSSVKAYPLPPPMSEGILPPPAGANRQSSIRGVVIDANGVPIGKASVRLHAPNRELEPTVLGSTESADRLGHSIASSECKPDGTFAFDGLAPDSGYGLLAITGDGGTVRVTGIELKDGETREIWLPVKPGWAIRGRAILGAKPCARARVITSIKVGDRAVGAYTVTGHDGRFLVHSLQPGMVDIEVTHDGRGETRVGRITVELGEPGMKDVGDIDLGSLGRIAGRVLDPTGAPLKDATVHVIVRTANDGISAMARTDAEGRFLIEGLGEGSVDVSVMPPTGTDGIEPLNLDNVTGAGSLTLQLKERKRQEMATLMIRLKHKGEPPETSAIRVSVMGDMGVVLCGGSSGNDVWTRQLEVGKTYWIHGSSGSRWGRSSKVTITAGRNEVELQFSEEGVAISAILVNDATGNPLGKATVLMSQDKSLEKGRMYAMGSSSTDDEGRFEFTGLAPDLGVWLRIDLDGYETRLVNVPVGGVRSAPIRLIPKAQ